MPRPPSYDVGSQHLLYCSSCQRNILTKQSTDTNLYIRPKKIPLLLLDDTVVLGWAVQANLQQVTAYTRSKWRHHPNERHQCMWQRQFLAAGDSFILLVERFGGSERHHVHNFDECSQHKGWMATVPLPLPILPCSTLTESLFMASGSLSHGFTDAPWHPKLSYLNWWRSKQIEHIESNIYNIHKAKMCEYDIAWYCICT
jgi:hypothetical protein